MSRVTVHRLVVWGLLLGFAAFFLAPLYVMLVTSFKGADEIRAGGLLSLPSSPSWDAWTTAWSRAWR